MSLYGSTVCQQFNVGCYPPLVVQPFIRWTPLSQGSQGCWKILQCSCKAVRISSLYPETWGKQHQATDLIIHHWLAWINEMEGRKRKENLKGKVRHWKHRCKKKNHLWLKRKDQDKNIKEAFLLCPYTCTPYSVITGVIKPFSSFP